METFSNQLCLQSQGDSWRRSRRWHLQPPPGPQSLPDVGSSPRQRRPLRRTSRRCLRQETCWHWYERRHGTRGSLALTGTAGPRAHLPARLSHCGSSSSYTQRRGVRQERCSYPSPASHGTTLHLGTRGVGRERLPGAAGRDGEKGQVVPAEPGSRFQGEGDGGRGRGCGWEAGGGLWGPLMGRTETGGVSGGGRAGELAGAVMEG